jgi:diguanylate cyclase (GGDEF)-like protein
MGRSTRSGLARAGNVVEIALWIALLVGSAALVVLASRRPSAVGVAVTTGLGVLFALVLARLAIAAAAQPRRRTGLLALVVAIGLWGVGSATFTTAGNVDVTVFPAPGEAWYLVAYVGFAAFIVLDSPRARPGSAGTWLEAAIVCGGTGSLAGLLALSHVAVITPLGGMRVFVALIYPLLDIVLAVMLTAQLTLRAWAGRGQAGLILAGFLILAVADAQLIGDLARGTYQLSVPITIGYGLAFAALTSGAARAPVPAARSPRRRTVPVILAVIVAVLALTITPAPAARIYLVVPALMTLVAAGWRMVLALRDADRVADALRLARSDDLTGLPNRRAVTARLAELVTAPGPLGFMIIDLDGFKDVNDTLGHAAGDTVLQLIARRTAEAAPPGSMLARLGGDEFALLVDDDDPIRLTETAAALGHVVGTPMQVDGLELTVRASVGIAVRTDTSDTAAELMRQADVAMYRAKRDRCGTLVYNPSDDEFSRQRLQLSQMLRAAISSRQLSLWYQPQIDATTGRVCGLEALVRWEHPVDGLLSPAVFLPVARQAGLMAALSVEVARQAVTDARRWRDIGITTPVAINLSPPELMSEAVLPQLYEMMARARLPADAILIEVTEDSFLADPDRARSAIEDVRRHGLEVSIDDYGTGFSSLSYLRDLPVQELKIDQSFITGLAEDEKTRRIVASTIQMAHALHMRTVAEGVEDAATTAELVAFGVDVLQGYHFARPMRAREVTTWLTDIVSPFDIASRLTDL